MKKSIYSVNPNISHMDLVNFYNYRQSCLEKQGKKREFWKSHQTHAIYICVYTASDSAAITFLSIYFIRL